MGEIEWIYLGCLGINTNNFEKIHTFLYELRLAICQGFSKIVVEGDSKLIVNMTKNFKHGTPVRKVSSKYHLEDSLHKLEYLINYMNVIITSHIKHNANMVVYLLEIEGVTQQYEDLKFEWSMLYENTLKEDYLTLSEND